MGTQSRQGNRVDPRRRPERRTGSVNGLAPRHSRLRERVPDSRMNPTRSRRPFFFLAAAALVAAWGLGALGARTGGADHGDELTASSVCEAHELKARLAEDPHLRVEIPAEFDKAWPTREACLSHEAAEDEEAPGPVQPIQFSHKHHAGLYEIDCQYCHSGTDRSPGGGGSVGGDCAWAATRSSRPHL